MKRGKGSFSCFRRKGSLMQTSHGSRIQRSRQRAPVRTQTLPRYFSNQMFATKLRTESSDAFVPEPSQTSAAGRRILPTNLKTAKGNSECRRTPGRFASGQQPPHARRKRTPRFLTQFNELPKLAAEAVADAAKLEMPAGAPGNVRQGWDTGRVWKSGTPRRTRTETPWRKAARSGGQERQRLLDEWPGHLAAQHHRFPPVITGQWGGCFGVARRGGRLQR